MADDDNKGYRVEDRRFIFREQQQEGKAAEPAPEAPEAAAAGPEAGPREPEEPSRKEERRGPLPPITFSTFIFSLNSSALIHLGEHPDPVTGQVERDLDLAKQTIDLLGLLRDKTRGNLSHDEEQLLEAILFDLRLRYVRLKG